MSGLNKDATASEPQGYLSGAWKTINQLLHSLLFIPALLPYFIQLLPDTLTEAFSGKDNKNKEVLRLGPVTVTLLDFFWLTLLVGTSLTFYVYWYGYHIPTILDKAGPVITGRPSHQIIPYALVYPLEIFAAVVAIATFFFAAHIERSNEAIRSNLENQRQQIMDQILTSKDTITSFQKIFEKHIITNLAGIEQNLKNESRKTSPELRLMLATLAFGYPTLGDKEFKRFERVFKNIKAHSEILLFAPGAHFSLWANVGFYEGLANAIPNSTHPSLKTFCDHIQTMGVCIEDRKSCPEEENTEIKTWVFDETRIRVLCFGGVLFPESKAEQNKVFIVMTDQVSLRRDQYQHDVESRFHAHSIRIELEAAKAIAPSLGEPNGWKSDDGFFNQFKICPYASMSTNSICKSVQDLELCHLIADYRLGRTGSVRLQWEEFYGICNDVLNSHGFATPNERITRIEHIILNFANYFYYHIDRNSTGGYLLALTPGQEIRIWVALLLVKHACERYESIQNAEESDIHKLAKRFLLDLNVQRSKLYEKYCNDITVEFKVWRPKIKKLLHDEKFQLNARYLRLARNIDSNVQVDIDGAVNDIIENHRCERISTAAERMNERYKHILTKFGNPEDLQCVEELLKLALYGFISSGFCESMYVLVRKYPAVCEA